MIRGYLLALTLGVSLLACQTPPKAGIDLSQSVNHDLAAQLQKAQAASASSSGTVAPVHFMLNVGDELEIKFPDFPQYDQVTRVRPDGKISMPLIGSVDVAGHTPDEVQEEISRRHAALGGDSMVRDYLILPGDDLEIKFPYQPDFSEKLKVRPDGKIQMVLVGVVQAEGRTPEELQAELRRLYGRHLKVPELTVILRSTGAQTVRLAGGSFGRVDASRLKPVLIVKTFSLPQVFVGGEVLRPGVLEYRPGLTLMQALVEAGGQRNTGEMESVIVLRKGSGQTPVVIRRDLNRDIYSADTNDIYLEPADVVILPKTAIASLGTMLEQYVFNVFPFIKNSTIGWAYQLNGTTTTIKTQ